MTEEIKTDFACIAEAVAYFYRRGFETIRRLDADTRVMVNDNDPLSGGWVIKHVGLLDVKCYWLCTPEKMWVQTDHENETFIEYLEKVS